VDGKWQTWTTAELHAERDQLSAGLIHLGLIPGDCVGILAHCGSPEWIIADAAVLQVGIISVPIHATARMDEIGHISKDAKLRAFFISSDEMLGKI
jgi:long-chain acyl-CoA synthetase